MADGLQPLLLLNGHIFLHDRHNHPFSWYNYRRYIPWPTVSREGETLFFTKPSLSLSALCCIILQESDSDRQGLQHAKSRRCGLSIQCTTGHHQSLSPRKQNSGKPCRYTHAGSTCPWICKAQCGHCQRRQENQVNFSIGNSHSGQLLRLALQPHEGNAAGQSLRRWH